MARITGVAALILPALAGCGAGTPGLHPVHPLPGYRVSATAGFSHHFVPGASRRAVDDAAAIVAEALALDEATRETLLEGMLVEALATPSIAPWLAARAGMGNGWEAGLGYSGRRVVADLRRAIELDTLALSVGGALTGIVPDPGTAPSGSGQPAMLPEGSSRLPGVELGALRGWGVSVPLLVGWRGDPQLWHAWLGARVSHERASGSAALLLGSRFVDAPISGAQTAVTGVFGGKVVLGPLGVAAELGVGWYRVSGDVRIDGEESRAALSGLALTPAAALSGTLD